MNKIDSACKVLILAGGKGTRLGELGKVVPKALVELNGKPILHHKFEHYIKDGFDQFIVATGYKGEVIKEYCENIDINCQIEFSEAGEEASMLQRISEASELFGERVIVTYGDSISNLDLSKLLKFHNDKKAFISFVVSPIQSPFGLVTFDMDSKVESIEEKPILHYYVGTFIMEKVALDYIPDDLNKWKDGTGLIAFFKIMAAINKLHAYVHKGADVTFNTIEELNAAEVDYLKFHTHFK